MVRRLLKFARLWDELECWTRVGDERGMRSRSGEP